MYGYGGGEYAFSYHYDRFNEADSGYVTRPDIMSLLETVEYEDETVDLYLNFPDDGVNALDITDGAKVQIGWAEVHEDGKVHNEVWFNILNQYCLD